ncbi:MAG: phosphoribosylamine--glycine ligase [Deltaproteobacteria bacterium]|nr:phosphoribosylamine--glycine ligase [Deltaproteobacteria bacterium]
MRVLVVGSGGREHALAWKIASSDAVEALHAVPGSDAMQGLATCHPDVKAMDLDAIVALARSEASDLVVVGPEDPLAAGLSDRLREAGIAVFGPSAAAAQLEASKAFAKEFMARHAIPTADFRVFEDFDAARAHVLALDGVCVVKADGLAAGKGVAVCGEPEGAVAALTEMMRDRRFGEAGARVVIEERLEGEEASYYAITDGTRVTTLAAAQDHKRALDGDRGENTGGMGAVAPAPVVTEAVEKRLLEEVVHPAIAGMVADGTPYTGVLYVGLMIDRTGAPRVVEFNVRFGDPETQPLMLGLDGDLVPLLHGAATGGLGNATPVGFRGTAVCVVLASDGYPRSYPTGRAISGLAAAADQPGVEVFHAGTRRAANGGFETAGGRVLGVTARGENIEEARRRAYAACDEIHFEGMHLRRDIAERVLAG